MSPAKTALLVAIVTAAFTVESAIGFGATVITVSLGALVASIASVLPAYIPVNMALSGYLFVRYRRDVAWRVLAARIAPFVAIGMPVGFWAGATIPERVGVRLFGGFVIALAISEAAARLRAREHDGAQRDASATEPSWRTWARDVFAMTACGVLFGMYGTGGPLAVWSVSHHARDPGVFRATLAALWFVLNAIVLARFAIDHKITQSTLTLTATFVPALVVGTVLGEWLHRAVPAKTFRTVVFALLFVVGSVLVAR
ncbi:MAG: sulfite exporter TauE/SafE family protein [Myxococcales bacterium]|nr:sulfite exporter TauE/SafE family protein [Myxococcales bacterium]